MTENHQFGPWATMFDTGPRARLSTFWKRRMAMLPSTASAEKKLSRRVRFLLLLSACAALSAPTVYLLRAPHAVADETTSPRVASPTPVDIPMLDPSPEPSTQVLSSTPTEVPVIGPRDEQAVRPQQPETVEIVGNPASAPIIEERVVREQVQVAPGQIETVERRVQVAVATAGGPAKPVHKIEFLPAPSANEEKILKALSAPTTVDFSETPLADVVDVLQDQHDIAIQLDKSSLEDEGIATDELITLHSKGLPLRSTLRRLLPKGVTFYIDDDVLMITAEGKAFDTMVTRTYPVGDLVSNIVQPMIAEPAQAIAPPSGAQPAAAGGMGGAAPKRSTTVRRTPSGYDRLVEAMTSTIVPGNWDTEGGSGSIVPVPEARSLVISQTHAAHDEVVRLLRSLRAARAIGDQAARESQPIMQAPGPATYAPSARLAIPQAAPSATYGRTPDVPQKPTAQPVPAQTPIIELPTSRPEPQPTPRAAPKNSPDSAEADDQAALPSPKEKAPRNEGGGFQ